MKFSFTPYIQNSVEYQTKTGWKIGTIIGSLNKEAQRPFVILTHKGEVITVEEVRAIK